MNMQPVDVFQLVHDFHEKFKVFENFTPMLLQEETAKYRHRFLIEEANEFRDSHFEKDLEGCLDAMVDIIYVAAGTMTMMGFTPAQQAEAFRRVHAANMEKMRTPSKDHSRRGSAYDVIKPEGWKAPDLSDLCR